MKSIKGPSFPFRIDPRSGKVAMTTGADKLRENLKHLLLTRVGERVMVRQYGGGATQLLHENINDGLVAVARHQLTKAILRYEPRILPQDISVIPQGGELYLRITYIEAGSPTLQTMGIPLGTAAPYLSQL
jgi:phage baseplate assembly protein W